MFRTPARTKRRTSQLFSFPAPKGGWIANQNLSRPDPTVQGAWQLTNFLPTATGAELRGGSLVYATLGETTGYVRSFLRYKNGLQENFFAAINSGIYDITTILDPNTSPLPAVSGTTEGDWRSTQFATTGGVYLVAVNGADVARIFTGEVWFPAGDEEVSQLSFDGEVEPFTMGETVTGGTSGASGTIVAIRSNAGAGYLLLTDVSGDFQDNETLTDGEGGEATANGADTEVFLGVDGVDTASLDYVWTYKNRLFFIERNSMNVWYASVDSIGGTLTRLPLGGVFPQGGSLLFGASWSLESSGEGGLSEQCIFVTTEGEVAAFQGGNPSDVQDWRAVGIYRIGKPLGAKAWFRAGGDVIIATDIGLVPLSQAINRDMAALAPASVSYPIETAWNEAVADRRTSPWHCAIWPERQMVVVVLPTIAGEVPEMFVANARTGAWCNFLNWDGACIDVFQGRMFFGSADGKVVEAYQTGADRGETYTGAFVPLFTDVDNPASLKITKMASPVLRVTQEANVSVSMQFDYQVDDLVAPPATPITGADVWGQAIWGQAVWGGGKKKNHQQDWYGVGGIGYAFAPALQITSGSIAPLEAEIVRIDVTFETAGLI